MINYIEIVTELIKLGENIIPKLSIYHEIFTSELVGKLSVKETDELIELLYDFSISGEEPYNVITVAMSVLDILPIYRNLNNILRLLKIQNEDIKKDLKIAMAKI